MISYFETVRQEVDLHLSLMICIVVKKVFKKYHGLIWKFRNEMLKEAGLMNRIVILYFIAEHIGNTVFSKFI